MTELDALYLMALEYRALGVVLARRLANLMNQKPTRDRGSDHDHTRENQ